MVCGCKVISTVYKKKLQEKKQRKRLHTALKRQLVAE